MNQDPMAQFGGVEIPRRTLLRAAAVAGGLFVAAGCTNGNFNDGHYDEPVPDPSPEGLREPTPVPETALHEGLNKSDDPALKQLGRNEKEFQHRFDANMLFVGMPRNAEEAGQQAKKMAETLREYDRQGIRPIVIVEPTYDGGAVRPNVGTLAKNQEEYSGRWDKYFQTLNWKGVTSEQMGTWVPFPEPNIPEWGGAITNADTFQRNFIPVAQMLRTHFNNAEVAILLNRTTCPDGDTDWAHATNDIRTLEEYVSNIPEGLATSFCLQGFPWEAPDRAEDYVAAEAAIACARHLGDPQFVKVWLNTGSFSRRRTDSGVLRQGAVPRSSALHGELEEARKIQAAGYDTSMVIFGQDKYNTGEGVDWSYSSTSDKGLFRKFLQDAQALKVPVPVTLFDKG